MAPADEPPEDVVETIERIGALCLELVTQIGRLPQGTLARFLLEDTARRARAMLETCTRLAVFYREGQRGETSR
jgi:hypothetical protein